MQKFNSFLSIFLSSFLLLLCWSASGCKTRTGGLEPIIVTPKKDSVKTTTNNGNGNKIQPLGKVDTFRWCDTLPQKDYKRYIVCYQKIGTLPVKVDTMGFIDLSHTNPNRFDTTKFAPQLKEVYRVAILMPFMAGGFRKGGEPEAKSLRAVEFYEGVKLALDTLRKEGVNLLIHVFDTRDSDSLVRELLTKEELLQADVIIGPVSSDELRTVSTFAKQYGKVHFSPFNPKEAIADDNPFYVQTNPSYRAHSRQIFQYLDKMPIKRAKNIIWVGTQEDSASLKAFQEEYAIYKNDFNARVKECITPANFSKDALSKHFVRGACNVVVSASMKETFVYSMFRELHSEIDLVESKASNKQQEDFVVFGLPQWKYFELINFEYFEGLRLHITSEFYVDYNVLATQRFKENYFTQYGMPPRDFGFTGFDMMLYVGRMLKKYGTGVRENFFKEPYVGRHTTFKFEPVYRSRNILDGSGNIKAETLINRYENSYLHVLKFEQFNFWKVNP